MPSDTLIQVESVSKKFCRSLRRSLWYGLRDVAGELRGRAGDRRQLREGEFWALQDVSFELRRGQCLGLIGPNGAGKSSLLKLLNGLIQPDAGRITVRGRVGALIELGTGFNPILTGRENIYVNAAVLGLKKSEVDRKFDEIVDFAELREFIDTPLRSYSSGMQVRLGFAVASQLEPDVLLIDEVLAVGDVGFRAKCYNRIAHLMRNCAIVLVSHSLSMIDRYCTQAMVLNRGSLTVLGDVAEGIDRYLSLFQGEGAYVIAEEGNRLESFAILDGDGHAVESVPHGGTLRLRAILRLAPQVLCPNVHIHIFNRGAQFVAGCSSRPGLIRNMDGRVAFTVEMGPIVLNPGDYKISLVVMDERNHRHLLWHHTFWNLQVTASFRDPGGNMVSYEGLWRQDA